MDRVVRLVKEKQGCVEASEWLWETMACGELFLCFQALVL